VDISFKDDVTVLLLLGASFLYKALGDPLSSPYIAFFTKALLASFPINT
jgi:hypothetical protein